VGRLLEAETDAVDALALAAEHDLGVVVPLALWPLLIVHVYRGRLGEAEAELDRHHLLDAIRSAGAFARLHYARGRVHEARGRHREAAADFLGAGEALRGARATTPTVVPWRSDAALALAAGGEDAQAHALLEEELALARRVGAPRALGLALRAGALLGPGWLRVARHPLSRTSPPAM
jgi:hypothetical protein